uniref:Uncharacterized protein n=1 Tax=Chlorocebus sabaeus TaxID=60711 RepID=A0A0D9SAU1_CHLSB
MIMPLPSTLGDEVRSHLKNKTKPNTFGLSTGRNRNATGGLGNQEDAKYSIKCFVHIISFNPQNSFTETIILIL